MEHLIRVVKIFKVAQERFRLRKDRYASIILTICGLVKLRKGYLILEIVKDEYDESTIAVNKYHSFGANLPLVTSNTSEIVTKPINYICKPKKLNLFI